MKTDQVTRYVLLILILQVASTAALWVLNVLSVSTTTAFELLLAANIGAFGIVLQAYRNPDSIAGPTKVPAQTAQAPPPSTAPAQAQSPPKTETRVAHEEQHISAPSRPALPPGIHIAIPILSIVVLFAFALVLFQPADKNAIPPTSTQIYIPVYLVIVVLLVFGSMYLFKRLMDAEEPEASH